MQDDGLLKRLSSALNKEYFAVGKSKVRSWEAIFLIGIISGFVGGVIWVASQTEDFSEAGAKVAENKAFAGEFAPGELIIKFTEEMSDADQEKELKKWGFKTKKNIRALKSKVVIVPEEAELQLAQALSHNPMIEFVEVNGRALVQFTPNDPYYSTQWHLPKISASGAWDIGPGSLSVVIGVLDTGVDAAHPDLSVLSGWNTVTNTSNSGPLETTHTDKWHGTAVSGTAASITNNGVQAASTARLAKILPVRVCYVEADTSAFCYNSDIAEGITWAADHGADVISMSLASYQSSTLVLNAVNYAWDKNIVLVAAAGNENSSTPLYPAAMNNVIAVAATDQNDAKASFSSYGSWVDLAAPGVAIKGVSAGGYTTWQGTSFSAPIVSGLAALMISANSALLNCQIEIIIKSTTDPLSNTSIGTGRVNMAKSMQAVSNPPSCSSSTPLPPPPPPPPSPPPSSAETFNAETDFSGTQGLNNWTYRTSAGALMSYTGTQWQGNEQYLILNSTGGHPGNVADAVRRWTSAQAGTVRITGNARDSNTSCGSGARVLINKNNVNLWTQNISNGNTAGYNFDLTTTVNTNDFIDFVINRGSDNSWSCDSTYFNPTIAYQTSTTPPPPPPPVSDTVAPTVSITSPANGSKLPSKGNATVSVSASDNVGVAQIDIFFDSVLRKQCFGVTSCTVNIGMNKVSAGTHTITAKAYDAAGNSATASISVTK